MNESIAFAKSRGEKENITNLHYLTCDAATLPLEWSNTFDYVTMFEALHDQFYPEKVLGEIFRVLKPGCYFSLAEINARSNVYANKGRMKLGNILQGFSLFHCMPVASQVKDGAGLGLTPGVEIFLAMVKKVGFSLIKVEEMPDVEYLNIHCIFQKPLD